MLCSVSGNKNPTGYVVAQVGKHHFAGEIIRQGFDHEQVVYVRDNDGQERAVRPQRPRHSLSTGVRHE